MGIFADGDAVDEGLLTVIRTDEVKDRITLLQLSTIGLRIRHHLSNEIRRVGLLLRGLCL